MLLMQVRRKFLTLRPLLLDMFQQLKFRRAGIDIVIWWIHTLASTVIEPLEKVVPLDFLRI